MKGNRRQFITGSAAAFLSALGWEGCVTLPAFGEKLPAWKPGELDLHFIYTGCGENMFYRLPDGTAILNDCGEFFRPKELAEVPLLPNASRLGGDWVTRYLQRVYPESTIDYAIFSHWHHDHIGHDLIKRDAPMTSYRYRTTREGRRVNGFLCVAEEYGIKRVIVHEPDFSNRYGYGTPDCITVIKDFLARGTSKHQRVTVGRADEIVMTRDPKPYAGIFSVRTLAANGVISDGKGGTINFAEAHIRNGGKPKIDQNMMSLVMLLRYGKFGYLATGDFERIPLLWQGKTPTNVDGLLGKAAGVVNVCKMGHHGCSNSMSEDLLKGVQSEFYIAPMWCPRQSAPDTMTRIAAQPTMKGEKPVILPQLICTDHRKWALEKGWEFPHSGAVHVVIKVAPGGGSYTTYLLDAHNEEMNVVAKFEREC